MHRKLKLLCQYILIFGIGIGAFFIASISIDEGWHWSITLISTIVGLIVFPIPFHLHKYRDRHDNGWSRIHEHGPNQPSQTHWHND